MKIISVFTRGLKKNYTVVVVTQGGVVSNTAGRVSANVGGISATGDGVCANMDMKQCICTTFYLGPNK